MKLCEHHLIGVLKALGEDEESLYETDPGHCWLRYHSPCVMNESRIRMWRGGEYVDLTAKFTVDRDGEGFILMEEKQK